MGDFRKQRQANSPDRNASNAERMRTTWPPTLSFDRALARARAGDQQVIAMLYRRFLSPVYRYVLVRVADIPTAEDVTSETFIAMIRGLTATRATDELSFAAWLLGIAHNQVLIHFRRTRIHPEVELQPHHIDGAQSVAEEDDPLLVLMARESWTEVERALRTLPDDQQNVVLYRCVLGYSTDEVAQMLVKKPGTIRVLQFRALASLTQHLTTTANDGNERRRHHAG